MIRSGVVIYVESNSRTTAVGVIVVRFRIARGTACVVDIDLREAGDITDSHHSVAVANSVEGDFCYWGSRFIAK